MRIWSLTLTLTAASLAAQQPAAQPWAPPTGWIVRLDPQDTTKAPADTRFVTMGTGFHVTSGPAAIYYRTDASAKGAYTVRATFGQRVAPSTGHAEAYGVFIGGSDLSDYGKQQYLYLLARGNGMFYVAHRAGPEVHPIVPWTAHDAVKKQNEAGSVTNEVAIQVAVDSVHLLVNAQRVKSFAKTEMYGFNTDGLYGLRVNHGLNVHIANFGMQP